jgi:hypothetical protein
VRTIFKYPLGVAGELGLSMPKGAQLLSVQVQHGKPCLWALVDVNAPTAQRRLAIRGTGHHCGSIPASAFVGTFQLEGGAFVGHLFDLGEALSGSGDQ